MRRRGYLVVSGLLAASTAAGARAIERYRSRGAVFAQGDGATVTMGIDETNAPVVGGELLEVGVAVSNDGDDPIRPTIESSLEGEPKSSVETTIDPGDTTRLPFGFRPAPVDDEETATVRFETSGEAVEESVDVLPAPELDAGATSPDREPTVRPGTTVLFEVGAAALGAFGGRTEWFVDGESVGRSSGPWYGAYYGHRSADYWKHAFDEAGTHEVRAAVIGDEETRRASWTITVADDGASGPAVEASRPEGETLEVGEGETVDLEVDVVDPAGGLERVVWWLGHADVVLGETAVSGSEDTASIQFDGRCHGCPILVWVIDERGCVASDHRWTVERRASEDPDVNLAIVGTNDPVDTGSVLEVAAALTNATGSEVAREVDLVVGHDPTRVDRREVSVAGGETATVDLEFTTADVRRTQSFPARVETADAVDEVTVEVIGSDDVGLDVTINETNAPVRTGEFLEVVADVENPHDSRLSEGVQLVVGHDPTVVEARTVTLEPGDAETVTMGYETATVSRDQAFPVRAVAEGDADEETVFVYVDEPPLQVEIRDANDPVAAGEPLEVVAEVANPGESTVERTVEFVVGHDPQLVDAAFVRLAAGETATVDLEFTTATVPRTQTFPVRVSIDGETAERTVEVVGAEEGRIDVTGLETDAPVAAGETLEVTADLEASGDGPVSRTIVLDVGPHRSVDATTVSLEGGETRSVTFSYATTGDDVGERDVTVRSDDDESTTAVPIEDPVEPATFEVHGLEGPGSIEAGSSLAVTAEIANAGEESGRMAVALDVGDRRGVDERSVSLDGGATTAVTLESGAVTETGGELDVTVRTSDDERTTSVTVREPDEDDDSADANETTDPGDGTASPGDEDGNESGEVPTDEPGDEDPGTPSDEDPATGSDAPEGGGDSTGTTGEDRAGPNETDPETT